MSVLVSLIEKQTEWESTKEVAYAAVCRTEYRTDFLDKNGKIETRNCEKIQWVKSPELLKNQAQGKGFVVEAFEGFWIDEHFVAVKNTGSGKFNILHSYCPGSPCAEWHNAPVMYARDWQNCNTLRSAILSNYMSAREYLEDCNRLARQSQRSTRDWVGGDRLIG